MDREQRKQNFLKRFFRNAFTTEDLFYNNEVQANLMVATSMLLGAVCLLIVWALSITGVFDIGKDGNGLVIYGIVELMSGYILCIVKNGSGQWMKYVLMLIFLMTVIRIDYFLSYNVTLLMALPVILSCRYFSTHFTAQVACATAIGAAGSTYFGSLADDVLVDFNFAPIPKGVLLGAGDSVSEVFHSANFDYGKYALNRMLQSYLPRLLVFVLLAIGCIRIAQRGRKIVLEQAEVSAKTVRIESELNLATDIQANMLPRIFPAFPEHDEFDVYATMSPAKEVGGDFYDYFMPDDTHVAIVIADVSGKGVPAALFMVTAKTLIKDHTQMGLSPEEVFTRVNRILCEGNDSGMFVTGWMGILDLQTGRIVYANAGHNPPFMCTDGKSFHKIKQSAGFVLAGLENYRFRQGELQLKPGDKLYLYTDGVTEATDADKNMYGEKRLEQALERCHDEDSLRFLKDVRADIDAFVGEAEPFDDITMLILEYKKPCSERIEKTFAADVQVLPEVTAFVEEEMEKAGVPMKEAMQITIAAEEIFVNIASYSYPGRKGEAKLLVSHDKGSFTLCFKDTGIPFNPLANKDPDVKEKAENRKEGGLGIYMVKKTMDDVTYRYKDSMNILTFCKKYTR